jgi:NAD(P)-dependent dehydrogenase (short-subunit alcohol dehydrogenase family)
MAQIPPQEQPYPGRTDEMSPQPDDEMRGYTGSGLLAGKRALVTGGDSGIGRAVAVAFAKEGADVAIAYLSEDEDAEHTRRLVDETGRRAVLLPGNLAEEERCQEAVDRTAEQLGGLDVLVNNVAYQQPVGDLTELSTEQLTHTFQVNIFSYVWTTKAALAYLPEGSGAIVNSGSVNGLRGNRSLIDYAATKGAVTAFTYSMAQSLVDRGIRVNCVAPGPVWTPLIPATFPAERVEGFGEQAPVGRAAHPDEIAPSYVFFASERLSSYYTGEVLAPTGGEIQQG